MTGDKYNITIQNIKYPVEKEGIIITELASIYLASIVAYRFALAGRAKDSLPYSFASAMAEDIIHAIVCFKYTSTISDKLCNFNIVKSPST